MYIFLKLLFLKLKTLISIIFCVIKSISSFFQTKPYKSYILSLFGLMSFLFMEFLNFPSSIIMLLCSVYYLLSIKFSNLSLIFKATILSIFTMVFIFFVG